MGEEVKIDVIKLTQNSLSKYIKKPPLTEKLLRKPPFRYIHDITTAVMRETGYLQGLFTQDELNPENIKDRDAKIAFLDKLIAAVNLSTGISISARPNKIVAGLDVAKTNELLQAIGKALDKKIDSAKAVEQVLTKKGKSTSQHKRDNAKAPKETKAADTKSRDSRNSDTLKKKSKDKVKNSEKPEIRKGKQSKDASPTKLAKTASNKESPKQVIEVDRKYEEEKSTESTDIAAAEKPEAQSENVSETEKHDDPEPKHDVKPPPPSPAIALEHTEQRDRREEQKKEKTKREKIVDKTDGLETYEVSSTEQQNVKPTDNFKEDISKSGEELKRPQSARAVHRKKVPKKTNVPEGVSTPEDSKEEVLSPGKLVGEQKDLSVLQTKILQKETSQSDSNSAGERVMARESKRPRTAARPASARPGAPRVRDRGTVLLKETENKELSEPVNLIVDSKDLPKDDDETLVTVEAPSSDGVVEQVVDESHLHVGDQGHLVSQILETQKELEENAISETGPESHKVDISWSSGRQEAVAREVEKLRTSIQALTRAVNPLGKLIDFLQEDVDSMQTELESWLTTNQQLSQQLLAEQRMTEECIEPLARQLEDIEQLVEEQLEEISVVKANIIRNDERLTSLLRTNTSRLPG